MTCYCARDIEVTGSDTQANYNSTSTAAKFKILEDLLNEARRAGLSENDIWNMLMIMDTESKFNPHAVSGTDVVGLLH